MPGQRGSCPWTRGRGGRGPPRRSCGCSGGTGQLARQETVGQVQLPLCWMVTPQLLPLPLGLATSCWAVGKLVLTFQVDRTLAGDGMFIVTVQVLEPET